MAVLKILRGKVVQAWRDVETVDEAVSKYGLRRANLIVGDGVPGMLWAGGVLSNPPPSPAAENKHPIAAAARILADGHPRRTEILTLLGDM